MTNQDKSVPVAEEVDWCDVCLKGAAKKCAKCRFVLYCSKECQRKDWQTHKEECARLSVSCWTDAVCFSHCLCKYPGGTSWVKRVPLNTLQRRACTEFCVAEWPRYLQDSSRNCYSHPAYDLPRSDRQDTTLRMTLLRDRGFDWAHVRSVQNTITGEWCSEITRQNAMTGESCPETALQDLIEGPFRLSNVQTLLPFVITSTLFPSDNPLSAFLPIAEHKHEKELGQAIGSLQKRIAADISLVTPLVPSLIRSIVLPYLWFPHHLLL